MVIPSKHLKICDSLVGIGTLVIDALDSPRSFAAVCTEVSLHTSLVDVPKEQAIERILLAVDFLFCVGIVELRKEKLTLCP